ncbi:hypothetical protein T310_6036, partial [Rasamsonia emersonii CBS 393.64]
PPLIQARVCLEVTVALNRSHDWRKSTLAIQMEEEKVALWSSLLKPKLRSSLQHRQSRRASGIQFLQTCPNQCEYTVFIFFLPSGVPQLEEL